MLLLLKLLLLMLLLLFVGPLLMRRRRGREGIDEATRGGGLVVIGTKDWHASVLL